MLKISGQDGGGQILRSALTLSMITGTPFHLTKIRGKRPKPGLMRQHLTCVNAAAEICDGSTDGAELLSTEVIFNPGKVSSGDFHFKIGTAGSTTLLAQTLLPALWQADGDSTLTLEGGTHNPLAPPMDYLTRVYLPMLEKMGVTVEAELVRFGFAPAGGGKIRFKIPGGQKTSPLVIVEKGEELERRIHCLCAHIPGPVAQKETRALLKSLDWPENTVFIEETEESDCAGNLLAAEIRYENVVERVSAHGAAGKSSQRVASDVHKMMMNYLGSEAPVGRCLADQLLLPMALSGSGSFHTMALSNHVTTNAALIEQFLPIEVSMEKEGTLTKISVNLE